MEKTKRVKNLGPRVHFLFPAAGEQTSGGGCWAHPISFPQGGSFNIHKSSASPTVIEGTGAPFVPRQSWKTPLWGRVGAEVTFIFKGFAC